MTDLTKIFKVGDSTIQVPQSKNGEVFLPYRGINSEYTIGRKVKFYENGVEKSKVNSKAMLYLDAVVSLQQWHLNKINTNKNNPSFEAQGWRHLTSSLLTSTGGWCEVNVIYDEIGNVVDIVEFLLEEVDLDNAYELSNEIMSTPPAGHNNPKKLKRTTDQFYRDARVVAYILKLAKGKCELCQNQAPFITPKGNPFLEIHHMKPLSQRGSDTISNTVALCPNCHKSLHFSSDKNLLTRKLFDTNSRLIRE